MLIEKSYQPKGYACKATYKLESSHIEALDSIAKANEFDAFFWGSKIEWLNNGDLTENNQKTVRINGKHYVISPEESTFKGHGGRRFVIEFISGPHKGEIIETRNLWHQGEIPEELLPILKDNAVFKYYRKEESI